MWCLKGREGLCVYILPNEKKSFGKTLSDIKLVGDSTISRLHAIVSVEPTKEAKTQYECVINDVSKYGTFIIRDKEKKKLPHDDKFVLKAGDTVHFGLKEYTFVVLCHSFTIARSSLNEQDSKKLKDITSHLKVTLSEAWESSCTHLTVSENTLFTTKLACALASAKPIVTTAYWEAVNAAIEESKELPKIDDFLPKVKEELLTVSSKIFLPNEKRRTLFKGLSFVHFCAKQYFAYAPLITAAGGKSCVYPTKRPLTPRDLTAKNAIVIQQPANDSSQLTLAIAADYPAIYHKLQAVKRRMVSDTEIPLAILYCNTETYCNPKYNFATFLKSNTSKVFPSDTLIQDTQDVTLTNTRQMKRKIIPETCESQDKKQVRFNESEINESFDTNKSNIATSTDNRESKDKIIPETCDSQTNKQISKSSYSYENECVSSINESNSDRNKKVIQNDILSDNVNEQLKSIPDIFSEKNDISDTVSIDTCAKNINKKIIFETSDFEEIVRSALTAKEEQQNVKLQERDILKENFAKSNKNMLQANKCGFQQQKNSIISEENITIIEKNNSNTFSIDVCAKNINKKIIFESSDFEEIVRSSLTAKEEQQNVKLQERNILKENFAKTNKNMLQANECGFQQQKNSIIIEENNTIFEKNNIDECEHSIAEEQNLNYNNGKFTIARGEGSKNAKTPHTVVTKEIINSETHRKQGREDNLSEKSYSRVQLQDSLKEQTLSPVCNSENNREDKSMKAVKIQMKDTKRQPRKTGDNEKYINQGYTDTILRKDVPCGKKFLKMAIIKPERILRENDFIL
ncbi:PREDICTED: nibrin [Vollenhovia emeryi]|uniref:nibrin n=1 Tax=Vollenhovia emeryi TaxID=411798 RepID=UPI0005F54AB1|nr:PREDICTED: nibrin [Vollenhovia emeryi]